MRDALLAIVSLALVIPSRCYGPQTSNQSPESDANIVLNYSSDVKDYGVVISGVDGTSSPSQSLPTAVVSSPETPASSPEAAARYWWQNSPFLKNDQPSILPAVSSTAAPTPAAAVELNIVADSGTTGVRVPSLDHTVNQVLYPNNPFLNGEVDRKTKTYTIAPAVYSSTVATTSGAKDYSNPGIEPLSSNSIAPPSGYPAPAAEHTPTYPTVAPTPYPGCAAALKCVPETYCNSQGYASDTPVVLTKEFLYSRVPLTDCLDEPTGIIGKCCRDPNYKDPWPADLPHEHGHEHGHEQGHEHSHEHEHEHTEGSNDVHPDSASKPSTGLHVIPISAYQPASEGAQPAGDYGVPIGPYKPPPPPPSQPSPPYGQPQQPSLPPQQPQPTHPPHNVFIPPYKPGFPPQSSNHRPPPQQPFHPPLTSGGSQIYPGPGSQPHPGSGSQIYPGPGSQPQPGSGSQIFPGPGLQPHPGPGSQIYPGPGSQPQPGSGSQIFPGPGLQPHPGSGSQIYPGPGLQPHPGSGSQIYPGSGSQPHPGSGSQTYPGPGLPLHPGSGSQTYPGAGSHPHPGSSPTFPPHLPSYGGPSKPPHTIISPPQSSHPPIPVSPPPSVYPGSSPQESITVIKPGSSPSYPSSPAPTGSYPPPNFSPAKPGYPTQIPPQYPSKPSYPEQPPPQYPSKPSYPEPPPPQYPSKPPHPEQPTPQYPQQPPPHYPQQPPPQYPSKPPHPEQPTPQYPQQPPPHYPQQPPPHYPQQPPPQYPQQPSPQYPQQPPPHYPQHPTPQYPPKPPSQYPEQSQPQYPYPQQPSYPDEPSQSYTASAPKVVEVTQAPIKYHIVNKFGGGNCGTKKNDETAHGKAPWHVIVYSSKNKDLICAGAIVSENAILTAAHCLDHSEAESTEVKIGPQGKMYKVAAIARHFQYEPISFNRDLALVFLHEPIPSDEYAEPICLPSTVTPPASQPSDCYVSSMDKDFEQSTLEVMPVEVFPYKDCEIKLRNTYLGKYFILNDSFSCVSTPAEKELCSVKTGSPIACSKGDGSYELFGIKSWDLGCQQYKSSAIFSNADLIWIQNTLSTPLGKLSENEKVRRKDKFKGESLEGININDKPGFGQGYGK